MATVKITVTLEEDQVRAIRDYVASGKSDSVSAFVKHAVAVALFDATGWKTMLDEALHKTGGPLTKEECAWADSLLTNTPAGKAGGRGTDKNRAA